MAEIAAVIIPEETFGNKAHIATWSALTTTNDFGSAFRNPGAADRSFQVTGTFGVGGTCILEGSNDGVIYAPLNDPQGSPISLTAAGIVAVLELTRDVRPRITGGDGATNLEATLIARRSC